MAKKTSEKAPGFEQSIARLEEIIRHTDSASTALEEVISLVEEGTKLIRHCKQILKKAELRIQVLETSGDDELEPSTDTEENESPDEPSPFKLN